ncbi:DUF5719 family protein [Cellulomonas bogoriensis]|uniref:DUF5719 family protein n=1 Tax=Cellulomonas bogoriensis TaxID=301388 RepID=UPI0012EB7AB3|nr:DUF5719 family protein [Cellulomonas bogoriensis]
MTSTDPVLPPDPEPVHRAGRVGRVLVRAATGAGVLGLTAAVVTIGSLTPPRSGGQVEQVSVPVPPAVTTLVCPGPARLPTAPDDTEDVAYDPQFDPTAQEGTTGVTALSVGAVPLTARTLGAEAENPDGVDPTTDPVAGTVLRAGPGGDGAAWAAGTTLTRADEGDLRGLVGGACRAPAAQSWLVGGSTSLGSSARLVLQNPGSTAATVDLSLWGPTGPVEPAGAPQFLVPAGTERVVLLEGLAAEQRRIVVGLVASGGLVTAYLQDSRLEGLIPRGVDLVTAGAMPAGRQVVPGLAVQESGADGEDVAVLRLLAPHEDASVEIRLLGVEGEVELPGATSVDLEAGSVLDVPVGGLPAGDYTVVVEADAPVVAAGMVTRGGDQGLDVGAEEDGPTTGPAGPVERAWVASVHPSEDASGVLALPPGVDARLVLASVGRPAGVELELRDADGAVLALVESTVAGRTTSLTVPALVDMAEGADELDPARVAGVVVRTASPDVAWAAVLEAGTDEGVLVSVLVPPPSPPDRPEITVRVR